MENSSELKSAGLITGGLVIGGIYNAFFSPALLCTGSGQEEAKEVSRPAEGASLPRREPRQWLRPPLITRRQGCQGFGAGESEGGV